MFLTEIKPTMPLLVVLCMFPLSLLLGGEFYRRVWNHEIKEIA